MDISALVEKLIQLFFALAVGFTAAKCGVLNRESNQTLTRMIVNITNPLQILASVMTGERLLRNGQVLTLTAINFACYALLILLGLGFVRLLRVPERDARVYRLLLLFSNVGFLGYPLAEALLGPDAKFCITISVLCFHLVCWTYGAHLMEDDRPFRFSWRMLLRPCVFCSLLAYAIYLSGLRLPAALGRMADSVGSLTGCLAMIVIGVSLAQISLRRIFCNPRLYVLCLLKLIVMPLLFWAALHSILHHPMMLTAGTLTLCMPAATIVTMLCYQYGHDETLASSGVFLSTLLSLVTIPLLMALLFL